jgi:5-methylcytosine-specific restriction endonuclease McrA
MSKKDRTIDHIIPLSKGGTGDVWNLRIVHLKCNLEKWAKMPDELNFTP